MTPYDAIMVLGARLGDDGEPLPLLQSRLDKAIEAYMLGMAPHVVLCGGNMGNGHIEAEAMKLYLLRHGIGESALYLEPRSVSTRGNLLLGLPVLQMLRAEKLLVVTTNFHALRTYYNARQLGMRVRVYKAKPPFNRGTVKAFLREFAAGVATLAHYPPPDGQYGLYYRVHEMKGTAKEPQHINVVYIRQQASELQEGHAVKPLAEGGGMRLQELCFLQFAQWEDSGSEQPRCVYVVRGGMRFETGGKKIKLTAGDSAYVPARVPFCAEITHRDTMALVCQTEQTVR